MTQIRLWFSDMKIFELSQTADNLDCLIIWIDIWSRKIKNLQTVKFGKKRSYFYSKFSKNQNGFWENFLWILCHFLKSTKMWMSKQIAVDLSQKSLFLKCRKNFFYDQKFSRHATEIFKEGIQSRNAEFKNFKARKRNFIVFSQNLPFCWKLWRRKKVIWSSQIQNLLF